MTVNAFLYVSLGLLAVLIQASATDDAEKYIEPATLFYIKWGLASLNGGILGLKMYRSNPNGLPNGHGKPPVVPLPEPSKPKETNEKQNPSPAVAGGG